MTYRPPRNTTPGDHVRPVSDHEGRVGKASPSRFQFWRSVEVSTGMFFRPDPVV